MDAELFLLFFLPISVVEHVRSETGIMKCPPVFVFCNSKIFEFLTLIFRKKQVRRKLLGMSLRGYLKCNITHCFSSNWFKVRVD